MHVYIICIEIFNNNNNNNNIILVKPVYNDHSKDQVIMVSVDTCFSYGGALVQLKCMDYISHVVYKGGLSMQCSV